MEWKRVKTMLIVIFLFVDIFLIYQIYIKNRATSADTLDALNSILISRNIEITKDVNDIEVHSKMPKLLIRSDKGIDKDIMLRLDQIAKDAEYTGSSKKIADLSTLVATFIRDNKAKDIIISDIYLCYFYNSNQIGENVTYAEAEPTWVIELSNGEKFLYNAYTTSYEKKV